MVLHVCWTEGDLVATGGSGRSGLRYDFREDVMGHVDQAVHLMFLLASISNRSSNDRATRGNNILDKAFTNISKYFDCPCIVVALGFHLTQFNCIDC